MVSEIAGELARVKGAFAQPTLTLLHQRQAPVVITIFRAAFGRNNNPIPTARLHTQVEEHLAQMRLAGEKDVPTGTGREICQRWMRGQWLVRSLDEAGHEVYALTSHAQQALELVKNLARDRATLSEHRIATILGTVRRFNSEANPDRTARVTILNEEIARLRVERDRLVDGGELEGATEDYMLEGFTELLSLISALPSDFARVEERFATIRTEILAAFRAEDRPAGEVIDDYLARADALMTATHEGRAFEGAFALLRDDALVTQLREDLTDLLEHPLVGPDPQRRRPGRAARHGAAGARRPRPGARPAVAGDGDAEGVHRLPRRRPRPRARADAAPGGVRADDVDGHDRAPRDPRRPAAARADGVDHLRERFYDPADDVLPDRISTPDPDLAPPVSLAELVAQGGPEAGDAARAPRRRDDLPAPGRLPRRALRRARAVAAPAGRDLRTAAPGRRPRSGGPRRRPRRSPPSAPTGAANLRRAPARRCPTPTSPRPAAQTQPTETRA